METPAEFVAGGAEGGEHAGERPEREQHAGGEGEAVQGDLAAVGAGLVDEAEDLDPEHGKDARHEVEDESADEGEEERGAEAGDGRGGIGGRASDAVGGRVGGGGCVFNRHVDGEGRERRAVGGPGAVGAEHAGEALGRGVEVRGDGQVDGEQFARGGLADDLGFVELDGGGVGEEPRVFRRGKGGGVGRVGRVGGNGEAECNGVSTTCGGGGKARKFAREGGNGGGHGGAVGGIGSGRVGLDGQREGHSGFAGHADLGAHEPLGLGGEGKGVAGREIAGWREGDGQVGDALVAVAGDHAGGVADDLGGGPLDVGGSPAGR